MMAAPVPHAMQHYNEIRVTPLELDASLATFRGFVV